MATDQGYPLQQYTNLQGSVVLEVLSDGTIVLITGVTVSTGTGSPNGVKTAPVGSLYIDKTGVAPNILYQKQTGTGNTGWVALGGGGAVTPGGNDTDVQFNSAGSFGGDDNFSWGPPDGLFIGNQTAGGLAVFAGPQDTGNATLISAILSATMDNAAPANITTLTGAQISANAGTPHAAVTATDIIALQLAGDVAANVTANTVTLLDIIPQLAAASGVTNTYGIHIESGWELIPALGVVRPILVEDGISQFDTVSLNDLSAGLTQPARTTPYNGAPSVIIQEGTGFNPLEIHATHSVGIDMYEHTSDTRNPTISMLKSRGTQAAPAHVNSGDFLGTVGFGGFGTTAYNIAGGIAVQATQNWTDAAQGTKVIIGTTPNGSPGSGAVGASVTVDNNANVGMGVAAPLFRLHTLAGASICVGASNAAPTDANIGSGSISFYLDEVGNNLKVRVRYSNGTYKTATIALV